MINYISKPFKWFFKLEAASGLILLIAAIFALLISNSELSEFYFVSLEKYLFIGINEFGLKLSVHHWINDALMAILSALLLILIYVSVRFEFKYAVGAITALVHDVSITLGVFSILGYEVSLAVIAAFLTIVGYSLNDTIVIFDRVRENLRKYKNIDLIDVFNMSINNTLSRTVMTSITTLLALISLYLFGGEVIKPFALTMIIGVLVGTYSSIFIAVPTLLVFKFRPQDEEENEN